MIYITETIAGIFALNNNDEIIGKIIFEKDVDLIAEKIYHIQKNVLIKEYNDLLNNLKIDQDEKISIEDKDLALQLKDSYPNVIVQIPSRGGKYLRKNLIKILMDLNFITNESEFQDLVNKINTILTRKKISEASEKKDQLLIQAIETIDYIDKSVNVMSERIREWFGLHFPELDKLISNHLTYSRLVSQIGKREEFLENSLKELNLPDDKIEELMQAADNSMGAGLRDLDMNPLMKFGDIIKNIYEYRDQLADYLTDGMKEIAPNMSALVGPLLAARLISMGGGLKELARKPSSTIQVMGAENALFRSIKTGAKPPKHGIIFQWDGIHGSPWWMRGKIARALAGKLSIASRVDAYSSDDRSDELVADLEARVKEIKEKYPEPKKKEKKQKKHSKRKSRKRRKKK